jgi:hypothetical protein
MEKSPRSWKALSVMFYFTYPNPRTCHIAF